MPKRVLIADDNPGIRTAIRSAFEGDNQFQICGEAVDGQDAIDKAHELKPDLIVLDFSMPVMNGIEAARVLSDSMPGTTMILYTMHTGKVMEAEAKAAGFKAILSKGEGVDLLLTQARSLLRRALN
jgi:DNA-binding NarL/FixJ family response regulator